MASIDCVKYTFMFSILKYTIYVFKIPLTLKEPRELKLGLVGPAGVNLLPAGYRPTGEPSSSLEQAIMCWGLLNDYVAIWREQPLAVRFS